MSSIMEDVWSFAESVGAPHIHLKMMWDHGYVYLMRQGDIYKIGVSSHPESRVKTVRRIGEGEISLVRKWFVAYPYVLEFALHREFSHCDRGYEWFALVDNDVVALESLIEAWRRMFPAEEW